MVKLVVLGTTVQLHHKEQHLHGVWYGKHVDWYMDAGYRSHQSSHHLALSLYVLLGRLVLQPTQRTFTT